jgi:hypothetical protein
MALLHEVGRWQVVGGIQAPGVGRAGMGVGSRIAPCAWSAAGSRRAGTNEEAAAEHDRLRGVGRGERARRRRRSAPRRRRGTRWVSEDAVAERDWARGKRCGRRRGVWGAA